MIQTAESLTQSLRQKNGKVMAVEFRLIQIELAAKRMLEFAYQARNAYAAHSLYEAQTALRAMTHAIVSCDSHIEHATIRIDAEITEVES